MDEIEVGDVIRKIRTDLGISLRAVSRDSGISPSALSQIENNKISPNLMTLKRIAKTLNVSVISLLASEEFTNISLIRGHERKKMVRNTSLGGDIIEEFLVGSVKHSMQPAIVTLPVDGGAEEFVSHDGEEFIFVLSSSKLL